MSRALGMEPLQLHCEDHVTSKMSVGNACAFLAAAVRLEDLTGTDKRAGTGSERLLPVQQGVSAECSWIAVSAHSCSVLSLSLLILTLRSL